MTVSSPRITIAPTTLGLPAAAVRRVGAPATIVAALALAALLGPSPAQAAPVVSTVTPSHGPTAGAVIITIAGAAFGAAGNTATVGGRLCPIDTESTSEILCTLPEGTGLDKPVQVTDDLGTASNTVPFSYDAPSITTVDPSSGPTTGGAVVTLTGMNFGSSSAGALRSVSVGSGSCTEVPGASSHTSLECTTPEGEGAGLDVTVTVDGQLSNAQTYSYDPPSLTSLDPSSGPAAGGLTLTISGENFGIAPSAVVGASACAVSSHTHTAVECTLPPGSGTADVRVTAGGQASAPLPFTYVSSPAISSVTPSSGPTAGGVLITIAGSNFSATGNTASVDARACMITLESPSEIRCTLPEGTGVAKPVLVETAAGTPSNTEPFSYAAPSISSIDPSSGPTNGATIITIVGTNFGPPSADSLRVVSFGPQWSQCSIVPGGSTHTSVECSSPEGEGATNPVTISVDGQVSNSQNFAYDPPAITSIEPTQGPTAGGTLLTINGTSFGLSASVSIDNNECPLATVQTPERLVCTTPPGAGTDVPVLVSVAGQSSNTAPFTYSDAVCGDGQTAPGEVCDDSNNIDLDGCSADCEAEHTQDKDQQACIVTMNKNGAKLAKAQGKEVGACAKAAATGKDPDPQTCVTADNKGKIAKLIVILTDGAQNKCASPPDFGPTDAQAVIDAASDEDLALTHALFGSDLNLAFTAADKTRSACQQAVQKAYEKVMAASLKSFGKCKKTQLAEGLIRAPSQLGSCADLILDDAKVTKAQVGLSDVVNDKCAGVDLATAFPGECAAATDFVQCASDHLRCTTCAMLEKMDAFEHNGEPGTICACDHL